MANITIRNRDDEMKRRLRIRPAEQGRSMEEEAREILRQVIGEAAPPRNLAVAFRARATAFGGAGLDVAPCEPMPAPPSFD